MQSQTTTRQPSPPGDQALLVFLFNKCFIPAIRRFRGSGACIYGTEAVVRMSMAGALLWGSCACRRFDQDESAAGNNESAGLFEKSERHFQFRISGISSPFLSMYCLCSISLVWSWCFRRVLFSPIWGRRSITSMTRWKRSRPWRRLRYKVKSRGGSGETPPADSESLRCPRTPRATTHQSCIHAKPMRHAGGRNVNDSPDQRPCGQVIPTNHR